MDRSGFWRLLEGKKQQLSGTVSFYPYPISSVLTHLDTLLNGIGVTTEAVLSTSSINDIGGADGDLAFYCEALGTPKVNLVDHAPTNFNGLVAATRLKEALNSTVKIQDIDLDGTWNRVEAVHTTLFLNTLYHLQNPFHALAELAKRTNYALLSTKVFDCVNRRKVKSLGCAYFYQPRECNNDPTNWWCFTDECLKRLLQRSGWQIIAYERVDRFKDANPVDNKRDGRAYAYLKRKDSLPFHA